jgi:hypothetical protein
MKNSFHTVSPLSRPCPSGDISAQYPQVETHWQDAYLEGSLLHVIEQFVDWCLKSSCPGFVPMKACHGHTRYRVMSAHISLCLQAMETYGWALLDTDRCFSAKVSLFLAVCKKLGVLAHAYLDPHQHYPDGSLAAEVYNRLIEEIRLVGKTTAFKKKVYREGDRLKRNFLSMMTYAHSLLDCVRSRLIVIRLDLKYRSGCKSTTDMAQAQKDLQHLLANLRSKRSLFADLEGYIWRLECGEKGGHHFHVILFFNNDHFQNDSHRAELIGKYWAEVITPGRGEYFNCNRSDYKRRFEQLDCLAIGRIEATDARKRAHLDAVLYYLCKCEQQISAKPRQRARTMGRGEMPVVPELRLGRPRQGIAERQQPHAWQAL